MAEKTEKPEKKTTAKTSTRAKASAKAPTATRAVKAPAKAAVVARPVAKRTVARKRTAPAVTPGAVEQWTWRRLRRKTKGGVVVSAKMAKRSSSRSDGSANTRCTRRSSAYGSV